MTRSAERRFRVMGSDAHIIVVDAADETVDDATMARANESLLHHAQQRLDQLEAKWSRFQPDSEVTQLSARAGGWVTVSDETALLVRRAVEAWRISGASFDPTVLGDMIRAGYDRSFDAMTSEGAVRSGLSRLLHGCGDIEVDGNRVRLPEGTGFDPGGIGKGLAADLLTAELIDAGAAGVCANVGGDLRVRGHGPTADVAGWTVGIDHPWLPGPIALVGLLDGAMATSTTLKRHWEVEGEARHHLIDPGTGQPSSSDLTLVTVIATEGWRAEILAKAVLLRGSEHPFDLLGGTGAEALCVDVDGQIQSTDGFAAFLGGVPLADRVDASPPDATSTAL